MATQQLTDRFTEAVAYATEAHASHVRKGSEVLYASHLLEVAALVVQFGGTEDQAIAGLLHDVVEDQGGLPRLADVQSTFGPDIAGMVEILSDATPSEGDEKAPWIERKIEHVGKLTTLANERHPAVLVAACDKISNARAVVVDAHSGADVFPRFKGGLYGTSWYYRAMHDALTAGLGPAPAAALDLACTAVVAAAGQEWDALAGEPDRDQLPVAAR